MLSADATNTLAICVLAALGLALPFRAAVLLLRSPLTPTQATLYGLSYLIARLVWRARLRGQLDLAPGQGAVIISNHRSPLDPAFIFLAGQHAIHWMVAKEYFANPFFAWVFRVCLVIPASRRGVDNQAVRSAIRLVAQGGLVGMFPEGRLNTTDQVLLPGRPGAAMIALKGKVPVVPCFIDGSPTHRTILGTLVTPAKVQVTIGRPIDVSEFYGREGDREVLRELTLRFLTEIARLGGKPDFQPEVAGRQCRPR